MNASMASKDSQTTGMVNCFTGSSLKLQADAALARHSRKKSSSQDSSSGSSSGKHGRRGSRALMAPFTPKHTSSSSSGASRNTFTPKTGLRSSHNTPATGRRRRGSAHHLASKGSAPKTAGRPRSKSMPRTPSPTAAGAAAVHSMDPPPHSGDTVMVIMRARPMNKTETHHEQELLKKTASQGDPRTLGGSNPPLSNALAFGSDGSSVFTAGKQFQFDFALEPSASQERVFQLSGRPIVDWCVDGYNGCILAYGNTGSGKTFTMMGPQPQNLDGKQSSSTPGPENGGGGVALESDPRRGMIPRALEYLFQQLQSIETESRGRTKFVCRCSFLELYQERFFDLLQPDLSTRHSNRLAIRERTDRSTFVNGLTTLEVRNSSEALKLLEDGIQRRRTAPTLLNAESSRSHTVFTIRISRTDIESNGSRGHAGEAEEEMEITRDCYLNLVDLAGSENQKLTQAAGVRLKEAAMINKSLSQLSRVIKELSRGRSHVSYRDSKLTFLLKDSLGGPRAKTCLIACVSPSSLYESETLSTLNFASRASSIANDVEQVAGDIVVRNRHTRALIEDLQRQHAQELKKLKQRYERQLRSAQHGIAVGGTEDGLSSGVSHDVMHEFLTALVCQRQTLHSRTLNEMHERQEITEQIARRAEALKQEVLRLREQLCEARGIAYPGHGESGAGMRSSSSSTSSSAAASSLSALASPATEAQLRQRIADLEQKLRVQKLENEEAARSHQDQLDSISDRRQEYRALQENFENLKTEHSHLRVELTLTKERQRDREKEIQELRARVEELKVARNAQQETINELRAELTVSKEVSSRLMKRRSVSQSSVPSAQIVQSASGGTGENDENHRPSLDLLNTSTAGVNISMTRTSGSFLIPRKTPSQLLQRSSSASSRIGRRSASAAGAVSGGGGGMVERSKSSAALLTAPQTFRVQPQLQPRAQKNEKPPLQTAPAARGALQATQLATYFELSAAEE